MIVLDSNVISETMRKTPDARVVAWLDAQPVETLYLAAISVAELRFGIARHLGHDDRAWQTAADSHRIRAPVAEAGVRRPDHNTALGLQGAPSLLSALRQGQIQRAGEGVDAQ